jgi:hypothetical protein
MKLSKTFLAVLATGALSCALFSQQAQANTITGSITFTGGATLDTGNANTAHSVTSFQNTVVQSVDGDFDTFINPLDSATFSAPWVFSLPKAGLWSVGGFTFNLLSSTVSQGNGFLNVSGTGTISGNGFDGTSGIFNFSTQNPGSGRPPIFSFSAASQGVPDGGSAVALLGLALTGMEVLRRKLKLG